MGEVGGAAEVAPIVLVAAKRENPLALGGEADVGVDDGEDSGFGEHGQEARRNDVDTGEGQRRFAFCFAGHQWRVASGQWRVLDQG